MTAVAIALTVASLVAFIWAVVTPLEENAIPRTLVACGFWMVAVICWAVAS